MTDPTLTTELHAIGQMMDAINSLEHDQDSTVFRVLAYATRYAADKRGCGRDISERLYKLAGILSEAEINGR